MVKERYIPEQGDIVYFNFSPSVGREQKGVRPGVVLSRSILNRSSGLALICPITSKQKFYPFEVIIQSEQIIGVALVDQVRAIDYSARKCKFVSKMTNMNMEEMKAKFATLAQ